MKKYVVMVKVPKPDTKNQLKEVEFSGRRHISIDCAHRELEQAFKVDTVHSGWIVEEETK